MIKKICYYKNSYFFTGSADSIIKLWSREGNKLNLCSNLEYHVNWITDLYCDEISEKLFSSSNDKTICIWDLTKKSRRMRPEKKFCFHDDYITSIKYIEPYIFSAGLDGKIFQTNIKSTKYMEISNLDTSIYSIDVTSEEVPKIIASLYDHNEIKVFDSKSRAEISTLRGHNDLIRKVRISRDGKEAISISSDATLKYWDVSSHKIINNFEHSGHSLTSLCVDDNFSRVIIGNIVGDIFLIDLKAQKFSPFAHLNSHIYDLEMDEDCQKLFVAAEDKLYFYDLFAKDNNEFKEKFSTVQSSNEEIIGSINLEKSELEKEKSAEEDLESKKGKKATVVQKEVYDYSSTNDKSFCILKFKDTSETSKTSNDEVYNLVYLRKVKSTYDSIKSKLGEINKGSNLKWCSVDIQLGNLTMNLNEKNTVEVRPDYRNIESIDNDNSVSISMINPSKKNFSNKKGEEMHGSMIDIKNESQETFQGYVTKLVIGRILRKLSKDEEAIKRINEETKVLQNEDLFIILKDIPNTTYHESFYLDDNLDFINFSFQNILKFLLSSSQEFYQEQFDKIFKGKKSSNTKAIEKKKIPESRKKN